jgi:hypothetical protein
MKEFVRLQWDPEQCRNELEEFRRLLADNRVLREREDLLPFFRERQHLAAFIGVYDPWGITHFDLLAYEYPLFGDFTCDLVVGDSTTKHYGFIELEMGAADNIFVRKREKATPEWAPRFERGYSQVVDWFWKLHEEESQHGYSDRFGNAPVQYFGLLIIGRDEAFSAREIRRLAWRASRKVVNSKHIYCRTFDQLYADLASRLKQYPFGEEPDKSAGAKGESRRKSRRKKES